MKIIKPDTVLTVREMKLKSGIVVKACRKVTDQKTVYSIRYKDQDPDDLILMGLEKFRALLAVSPSKSLRPKIKEERIYMVSLAQRSDEIYRMVMGGKGMYDGNEFMMDTLRDYGLQKKILVKGSQVELRSENVKVGEDSVVTVKYPIETEEITARKAGGDLDVLSIEPELGEIELDDDGQLVLQGTTVDVQYRTKAHLVFLVTDNGDKPIAAILSKELNDYLAAHQ